MIIEQQTGLQVTSSNAAIEATISESSLPFIFRMLTENFYSNPLGSLIREYTSNCLDSHTEAGVDRPVIVHKELNHEERAYYLIFEDFGVGLSTERMLSIFMDYGNSTKRTDNLMVGGFGLGSKSGLSYQESFEITTRYNGKEYNYIYSKGELRPSLISVYGYNTHKEAYTYYDEDLQCDVPAEREIHIPIGLDTDLPNGTQIKIAVRQDDNYKIEDHVKRQLAYFQNIHFKGFSGLTNDYTIYEFRTFFYRSDVSIQSGKLHVALGQVAYPLNYTTLGIDEIGINVALKFEIGELKVTPNREQLIYDRDVTRKILERIEEFKIELVSIANRQAEITDLREFIDKSRKDEVPVRIVSDGINTVYLGIFRKYLPKFRFIFKPLPEITHITRYCYTPFLTHHSTIYSTSYNLIINRGADSYGTENSYTNRMIMLESDEGSPLEKVNMEYWRERGFTSGSQLNVYKMISRKDMRHKNFFMKVANVLGWEDSIVRVVECKIQRNAEGVVTHNNGNFYVENKKRKKLMGRFIAYMMQHIKDTGVFYKDNLPSQQWIDDYKERTKIVRVKKPVVPTEEITVNAIKLKGSSYESTEAISLGKISEYKHVVYCMHSTNTSTKERESLSKVIRAINSRGVAVKLRRWVDQIQKNVLFISISQTNLDIIESKGMMGNFVYYQDLFQLDYFKRMPQHHHLMSQYLGCYRTLEHVFKRLSPYGERYLEAYNYLTDYTLHILGYTSSDFANMDLTPYNLPYLFKNDPKIEELYRLYLKTKSQKISRITLELLDKVQYSHNAGYAKALMLSRSQIIGLKEHFYSNQYLKNLIEE